MRSKFGLRRSVRRKSAFVTDEKNLLTRSQGPVLGSAEFVPERHNYGCNAEHDDDGEVDELWLEVAIEAIV